MISDSALAQLQLAAYEADFIWDWSVVLKTKKAGWKIVDGQIVIVLPGTQDDAQWRADFTAFPILTDHQIFGKVHAGFWEGIEGFGDALVESFSRAVMSGISLTPIIVGHSLGAGEAPLLAAELKRRNMIVKKIVAFAPPRAGMKGLADYLADIPSTLYCTTGDEAPCSDLVCEVPFEIPGLAPYCQINKLTPLEVVPEADDPWFLLKYHHMSLYAGALGEQNGR